jgi:hypothetical protein
VQVTKIVEGRQKNSKSGERDKSKAPKRVIVTRKRSRTQKRLALPSAKKKSDARVTEESLIQTFLSDPAWKQESLREIAAKARAAEAKDMLIRAQAKQAEAQAKQAEENRRSELLLRRHELLQQGIPAEDVDALLPIPEAGQSSV